MKTSLNFDVMADKFNVHTQTHTHTHKCVCILSNAFFSKANRTRNVRKREVGLMFCPETPFFKTSFPTHSAKRTMRERQTFHIVYTVTNQIFKWHAYADTEERRKYSSNLFPIRFQKEVSAQLHAPTVLPQGITQYSLYRRLGWPRGRSRRPRKTSISHRFELRSFISQPVAIPTELFRPPNIS